MPEIENQVNIGKLEVKVEELKDDFNEFKKEFKDDFKTLSANINTALTEMKICEVQLKANTIEIKNIKDKKIQPMENDLAIMKPTVRLIKWVAGVSFGAVLTFTLYLVAGHFHLIP